MKKKYLKTCISVLAVTAVLLSACGGPQQKNVGKTTMETAKLADSIRKKYNEKYEYADPIRGVARDERLKLKMGFDIMNAGFTEYTQIVNVYKDPELTYQIGSHFEWDEKTKELSVTPPRWSVGGIMSEGLDEDAPGYQAADSSLFDKGELNLVQTNQVLLMRYFRRCAESINLIWTHRLKNIRRRFMILFFMAQTGKR